MSILILDGFPQESSSKLQALKNDIEVASDDMLKEENRNE